MCASLCAAAGQGACLIFLATVQALHSHNTVVATHVTNTVLFVFYLGADSKTLINWHGNLEGWTFSTFLEALAFKNAVIQLINFFLIVEPTEKNGLMSARETVRNGSFFRKVGLMHYLIAFAYMSLTVIACVFGYHSEGLGWAVAMCGVTNFAIPIILSKFFDEQTIEEIAKDIPEEDFAQSDFGIDFELKEIISHKAVWFYMILTFIIVGNSRMINEQAATLALNKEDFGLQLMRYYQSFEIVGCVFFGFILIFFRKHISPGGLMVVISILLVISQANMLNPTGDVPVSTLVLITTILSAVTSGGYFVALGSYVHEEYGQEFWGQIYGFLLTAGCAGLVVYDNAMV